MRRGRFVAATVAAGLCALPSPADATGGLDPDVTPPPSPMRRLDRIDTIRILLANDALESAVQRGPDGTFSYAGRTYRGQAALVEGPNHRAALIATVGLEAYLYGVVPLEAGRGWPAAALAAQAIVARTYALGRRSSGRPYDVVAHEGDQVWGSREVESGDASAAIDATAGSVLTYGGGVASVFYSASCGGHTADATALWGRADLPYLRGVADPYCAQSPDAHWTQMLPVAQLLAPLGARLNGVGDVRSISLRDPQSDGRRALSIAGSQRTVDIISADVRRAVGPRLIRSPFWRTLAVNGDPAQAGSTVVIEGAGRGHGVGLCQWGMRAMAQQGRTAREILAFYLPGTEISRG